jgi:dihydrolipoamide dehydrogenase
MIAIVGGGPAGRTAAIRLANGGKEVLLVDKGGLGGQCLHHGCMVVCALNDVARLLTQSRSLHASGVLDSAPNISFPVLLSEMKKIQATIRGVLEEETRKAGVEICAGKEAHVDKSKLFIDGDEREADNILIATGSRPAIPDLRGITLPGVITPHNITTLSALPERLAIIGGGVIAAEYAYIFSGLGSEVEVLCRRSFLRGMNEKIQRAARKDLEQVTIRENIKITEITGSGRVESVIFHTKNKQEEIPADAVMIATGLQPRTENIDGLLKGNFGEVIVDSSMRTSVEGVYAAGDVTGPPYLTPVARREGIVAADVILGKDRSIDHVAVPQSIKLGFDHSFCYIPSDESVTVSIPSPAGPGSFWSVPSRHTGISTLDFEPVKGRITGFYASAPGSSLTAAYLAHMMRTNTSVDDMETFIEVHPSTDGIYGLIRYASEWLRRDRIL